MQVLSDGLQVLSLRSHVEVERILVKEGLGQEIPGLDTVHIQRHEPLKSGSGQTFLEQADEEAVIGLEWSQISTVSPQMGDRTSLAIIFLKLWDSEVRRQDGIRKAA
jgi:hypothetical protein